MNKYGIDYGTTNSSIAISYFEDGITQTTVVEVEDTIPKIVMPSKVLVTNAGYKVGRTDAQSANVDMIVRKPKDYLAPTKDYQVSESATASPPMETILVNGSNHETKKLIAAVLRKLRMKAQQKAQEYGITPKGVVMGVPVEYGVKQKQVLKEALVEAGFYDSYQEADKQTEFVSEPVAVAVDYGLAITENKNVFVFDFGGGTLDIAVMNLNKDVGRINRDHLHPHNVIAKDGADIGGELLTKTFFVNSFFAVGKYSLQEVGKVFGLPKPESALDLWNSIMKLGKEGDRFFEAVDKLKCDLSSVTRKSFDYTATRGSLKSVNFNQDDIKRALSNIIPEDTVSVFDRITEVIDRVLNNPRVDGPAGIDSVIVSGGSSMIPCVQELLYDKFPGQLHARVGQTQALTSIVRGLSIVGCREDNILEDIVDNDFGFWDVRNKCFCPIVSRGTKVIDTLFDRARNEGIYETFANNDHNANYMDIQIMQRTHHGETRLGIIKLVGTDDRQYRLYMNVDKKQGILRCFLFDTKDKVWLDDMGMVSQNECEYHFN